VLPELCKLVKNPAKIEQNRDHDTPSYSVRCGEKPIAVAQASSVRPPVLQGTTHHDGGPTFARDLGVVDAPNERGRKTAPIRRVLDDDVSPRTINEGAKGAPGSAGRV
jgi:hypothetical protein